MFRFLWVAALLTLLGLAPPRAWAEDAPSPPAAAVDLMAPKPVTAQTPNGVCLDCHGVASFATPTGADGASPKRHLGLDKEAFAASAHGKQACVACHQDVGEIPHKKDVSRSVDCVSCHQKTLGDALKQPQQDHAKLDVVNKNVANYLASIHAQPRKDDPQRANATCIDCHQSHYIFPMASANGKEFRLHTPDSCGRCHEKQKGEYANSVHGIAVGRFGKTDAATCADCHSAHKVSQAKGDPAKLLITQNCGGCHEEAYNSYRETYHGQVAALGYTHTAKCFDCHEHHGVKKAEDPASKVHKDNRLTTCKTCHKQASEGFVTFQPHGTTHDFKKYPEMWIASKFMILLLAGVFAFFWTHCALWFWAEWRDKKAGVHHVLIDGKGDPVEIPPTSCDTKGKHVRRFSAAWRVAHLALALAVMGLVLTGTSVLYAESAWAPVVMKLIGGPKVAAVIHRLCALTFAAVFFGHIAYALYNTMIVNRKSFRWFGPYSLLPRWQDFRDFWAMLKWFFGKGPRPTFDHWTYWEKFDYWAPFWGMFIIGCSGLMLWMPEVTARYLPGWVFNVATIVHGEEAFLAAVFLFTVHYFNCHFRPTKLPQDIVMFTGTVPLHEFIEERAVEYRRMIETGTLEKYLVDPPSAAATTRAKILGAVLILVGLVLLTLVLIGFWQAALA